MTVRCVEPANVQGSDKSVVFVSPEEDLLFPHVDSCLAITLVLNDGSLRGGHVGVQNPGQTGMHPEENAMLIFRAMLGMVPGVGEHIQKLILVGDNKTWAVDHAVVPKIMAHKGLVCEDILYVDNRTPRGLDVTLSGHSKKVTANAWDGGTLKFERLYSQIKGTQFDST